MEQVIQARRKHLHKVPEGKEAIAKRLLIRIDNLLRQTNPYAKDFKTTGEIHAEGMCKDLSFIIDPLQKPSNKHRGTQNLPTRSRFQEVSVLAVNLESSIRKDCVHVHRRTAICSRYRSGIVRSRRFIFPAPVVLRRGLV